MYDPADDPAVIGAMSARLVRWQQWRNDGPLLIIKPEFSCHDQNLPLEEIESHRLTLINKLIGF